MIFHYGMFIKYNWIAITAVCVANFIDTAMVIFIATYVY